MIYVIFGIFARIFSNSCLNVFQKFLTNDGCKPSVINFYTYFWLSVLSILLIPCMQYSLAPQLVLNFVIMGILGALGNYFIIKALSIGELSTLAPINSYKPIIAMIIAFLYLKEIPSTTAIFGILLIIFGTYFLHGCLKYNKLAMFYRFLALIFSGSEAVFIKKIILITNVPTSFALWALSGLIFSFLFVLSGKHALKMPSPKHLGLLILSVAIMQFSTNFVFSKINVSYALALFQLSTIISVFLGVNIFKEKNIMRKIVASLIMVSGAVLVILG